MNVKLLYQINAFVCCFLLTLQLNAFGLSGHIRDFQEVFEGVSGLEPVYKSISSGMDSIEFKSGNNIYQSGLLGDFKAKFGSLPSGNHRVIGHWGFEGAIPFNHEPYKTVLANYPKSEIIKLWQSFVKQKIDFVMECTGLPEKQAKGLTGLIYNTHLLGDHLTTYTEPLPHARYIAADIKKNLNRLLGNNNSIAKNVGDEIDAIPKNLTDKEYAIRVKKVLAENKIGKDFYDRYSPKLTEKDIDYKKPVVKTEKNLNKGKIFSKNSGMILSATVAAGFIIAHDAMRTGITLETFLKAGLASTAALGSGIILDYTINVLVTQTSKYIARRMLEQAGKKVTERAVAKLADKLAPVIGKSIGGGLQIMLSSAFIGKTIYDYYQGNISQTDMLVNVGIIALTTAGSVFFTCTTTGTKVGAAIGVFFAGPPGAAAGGAIGAGIGIAIGVIGGICSGGYTFYVENKRQESFLFETEQRVQWETRNNSLRYEERISELKRESEQMRNEAWQNLLAN